MRCVCLTVPVCLLLALLSTGLLGCSSNPEPPRPVPPAAPAGLPTPLAYQGGPFRLQWAMDTLWEDGRAEVATYAASRMVDGEPREFTYTLITTKEEFSLRHNVRAADSGSVDGFPVMSISQLCQIPADHFPLHYLTTLYFRRDQPVQLHKLTASAQEWSGNTFKAITDEGLHYLQTYNSCQPGQGAGQRLLPRSVLFEDALPYTLRALRFSARPAFQAAVVALQQTSEAAPPAVYQARLRTEAAPAGEVAEAAWRVTVDLAPSKRNVYWFARRYPHVLLRQTTWDGRLLHLTAMRRYAYQLPGS